MGLMSNNWLVWAILGKVSNRMTDITMVLRCLYWMSSHKGKETAAPSRSRNAPNQKRKSTTSSSWATRAHPRRNAPDYDEHVFQSLEAPVPWSMFSSKPVLMEKSVVIEDFSRVQLLEKFTALGVTGANEEEVALEEDDEEDEEYVPEGDEEEAMEAKDPSYATPPPPGGAFDFQVWVGKNRAAPLDPEEIEMLMGYPKHHTRGGGTSRTERFRSLGNSFQVDTVAFHLSVLKKMFPHGISVLSLFSGIGGAEVALHRLGIPLKNVVSVEISNVNRNILQSWWDQTNQKGNLTHVADVQKLSIDRLEELIKSLGGFDLIIGGSPCSNLTGSNRVSRDGLQGEQSILFYEYFRVLNDVKFLMG
ncbi:DNA (cytosine-5)-methyltransferase DRM2-like [Macadamia integrifolia]|uniref:DNA (cytosine-5)-methyltransferase DRM2-like n=1 Tax=Macadamia integrifolia TaxID=60698 RepID=UPI001C4F7AA6|nr:DNA (cytosine-5)-methyltransferase DRM2-like [Macadamia integrifolia]